MRTGNGVVFRHTYSSRIVSVFQRCRKPISRVSVYWWRLCETVVLNIYVRRVRLLFQRFETMSNWYHLLNRAVIKPKCYNTGSWIKSHIRKRSIFSVAKAVYDREKKVIITETVPDKVQISSYATNSRMRLSQNNVVKSAYEDLPIPQEFLHEYVWKNLERWPDKTATVCSTTGKSYTYFQLRTLSGKFASSLRKCRLFPGSTIAVVIPNIPEFAIIVLGASEAGIKITMSNPMSTAKEIGRQLINSEASAVITVPEQYSVVKESISGNSNIKLPIIVVDDTSNSLPDGSIRFSELISDSVEMFSGSAIPDRNNEDTIFLPYSSGTTGLPKGVELSHRNIVMNCEQLHAKGLHPGYETTETHQDVVPIILPLFHIYALTVLLVNYLSVGAKLVFLRKFNPEGALKCLKDFKSNLVYVAPPLILFLVNNEMVTDNHLRTVRYIMSGAAPVGSETVRRLMTKAKRELHLAQGYGLTETSPVISTSDNGLDNLDAVGYLLPNTSIRIVGIDESNKGRNMGVNETGELYVKGPQVMKGYYKNPEATANTMDGEWFKTGDIACYDDVGHIFIKDRLKELIKVKGFQVPPAELEELLRSNKGISDAAVIAEAHPQYGEIPKAFVVRKPGVKLDENAVKNFIAERVPKYKQLGSVKFIDLIPKSAAGKILRRQLKDL